MYDIDSIKARLSIKEVAQRLSIDIPRSGDALCPRHGGRSLRLKQDYFFCHGGCSDQGGKGDIFALYQFVKGCDFLTALDDLARLAGVPCTLSPDDTRKLQHRRTIEYLLGFSADYYTSLYPGSPAEAYAKNRGIDVADARLGYAPDTWNSLTNALKEAGHDLSIAEQAGLIKKGDYGYYDQLRHRLIIPSYHRGVCTYLQGRSLGPGTTVKREESDHTKYKNIALGAPPLYHINGALSPSATPIITESTTDVLRFASIGVPAVGTYGNSIAEHQQQRLQQHAQLIVAIHNDKAGYSYADKAAAVFGEKIRIAPPPQGYNDWDEALTKEEVWQYDQNLTWFRWRLGLIPQSFDPIAQKDLLDPLLSYLSALNDHARVALYLDEMKKYFRWSREIARGYERQVKANALESTKAEREKLSIKHDDAGQKIQIKEDTIFINPAQAYHDGIVYVSRAVTRSVTKTTKQGDRTFDVHEPVIITSDRRVITVQAPPKDAPRGTVIYIDDAESVALRSPIYQASTAWSYGSLRQFLDGESPEVLPHMVYDALMASLRNYVYYRHTGDYVITVLWAMGTYFHQLFDAFPYLAIHGDKGSGKTTVMHWLKHVAFNAGHVVNSSEASLYRWIETAAPTMLIDEQEGLNSRQAAKENKADIMGLLKAGYQKGAVVTRQDINDPQITQTFSVYSPKALAAVESFEDILEDRSILVYMFKVQGDTPKPVKKREHMTTEEFSTIRDDLYLLLMQRAMHVDMARSQVKNQHNNRFGELTLPLFTMAALIDQFRDGKRQILDELDQALAQQQERRIERNTITPEQMFREAIRSLIEEAEPAPHDGPQPGLKAQRLPDGRVVMDALHIHDSFRTLFPTAKESYCQSVWLGKQVAKSDFIEPWFPEKHDRTRGYRWRRVVNEKHPETWEVEPMPKLLSVYVASMPNDYE